MKRILIWIGFLALLGLIVWGLIVAENKDEKKDSVVSIPNEIRENDWVIGSKDAPVKLIEYSDFECPACALYQPIVKEVLSEYGGSVAFVYRHFPLAQHKYAVLASSYAEASGLQGKFWEMHDLIFENQEGWAVMSDRDSVENMFIGFARDLSLDLEKLSLDVKNTEIEEKIIENYRSGSRAGVNSTPTFFINGTKINNPRNLDEFKKLIEESIK